MMKHIHMITILTALAMVSGCATSRFSRSSTAEQDLMAQIVVVAGRLEMPTPETIARTIGVSVDELAYPMMKLAKRGALDWDGAPNHFTTDQPITVKKLPNQSVQATK